MNKVQLYIALCVLCSNVLYSEQRSDLNWSYSIDNPFFANSTRVVIDNGHNNYHTRTGRFAGFTKLVESDGLTVVDSDSLVTNKLLSETDIFVVANAISDKNNVDRRLPAVEAFTEKEIDLLFNWVNNGGSLLLIADHMPYPGSIAELAAKFGFDFYNAFAVYKDNHAGTYTYLREDIPFRHPVLDGADNEQKVEQIFVYLGSAFKPPKAAKNLLALPHNFKLRFPKEEWEFSPNTPEKGGIGLSQGAIMRFGKGKIAVFAEAAMFTTQAIYENGVLKGKVGFNTPEAATNKRFIINLMRWLGTKSNNR